MKFFKIFAITLFASACFFIIYSFGRAGIELNTLRVPVDLTNTHTINITKHNTKNQSLTLIDEKGNDATELLVEYGDEVIWNNMDAEIDILQIENKFLASNHFKNKPGKTSQGHWKGKVKSFTDQKSHTASYFIRWKIKGEGRRRTFDPLIKINPTTVSH